MFKFLRRRIVLVVVGLILLSLFIWYAGELFEFNDYRPLDSVNERLVAIAAVFVIWIISTLLKQLRANRASDKLVAAVVEQSHKEPPNPEAVRLREQFEDAVAALKQKRRSGHSLYDLPWYVFIGAPGSGKTTALVNSGLNFPLEQRTGKGALRGVGGTRNCDWWFTDEAIFLDTAGRYTTQDSDASSDSAGWVEFLALLKKYRKRRPVNGVILTVSAQDLMVQGLREKEAYVSAARRRLDELNRELGIQLPVYLMVTKCDLVAGFTEYFDDLTQEGRAQVWGVTFPYEQTRAGGVGDALPAEFDALIARLNERVFVRLDEERDPRRRARIFGFPQQMAALRDTLAQFVSEVFGSTRFDQQILLRGVYFTSGTQEGTPIDRLLGALGRRFAVSADAVAPSGGGRGKAYFIEHLLKRVLLPESGLAGINRRHEMKKAAVQLGTYAAMIAVAVAGVIAFAVSYNRNQAYIAEVAADVAELQQVPPVTGRSLERLLPRLDAVSRVAESANRFSAGGAPWLMRFGLYQGSSLGESARVAYGRELSGALLSQVAARIERRLTEYAPEPERLFEYLKAYLMLANPEHLDKAQLEQIGDLEWSAAYADDPDAAASASTHFRNLLANRDTLRPITVNEALVTQARNSIRQASIAQLMYRQLRLSYAGADEGAVRLDLVSGVGTERVLRRKSGVPLSRPVPALYTAQVFKELTANGTNEVARRFQEDAWVWGPEGPPETSRTTLQREVNEAYEDDYIAVWDALLKDVDVVSLSSLAMTKDALAILTGPTSPLRGFLKTVDAHTYLVPPEEAAKKEGGLVDFDSILKRGQKAIGLSSDKPGMRITSHFAQVHEAVAGEGNNTRIDAVLKKLEQVKQQLDPIGSEVGATGGGDPAAVNRLGGAVTEAKREAATLTPEVRVVGAVVTQVSDRAMGAVREVGRGTLLNTYEQDVLTECRAIVGTNYPFVRESVNDVPLADFGRLFGYGGLYETFFKSHLEPLVDTTRQTWTWREDATGAAVGGTVTMLRQFETAQRIRRRFFKLGATVPEVSFQVTPVELDDRASRFVLEINGQRIEDRHVATRPVTVRWPGEGVGEAAATFESRSGPRVGRTFKGPWAWFRLLATAELAEEGESVRYALTFRQDGLSAVVGIDSLSVNHPFGNTDLQNFQCR